MWGTSEGTANHMKSKPRNATKLFLLTAKDAIIAFSTEPDGPECRKVTVASGILPALSALPIAERTALRKASVAAIRYVEWGVDSCRDKANSMPNRWMETGLRQDI